MDWSRNLTLSHALASRASFNLAKKLDCPPDRNANRTWASSSIVRCASESCSDILAFTEDRTAEALGSSFPHISHWIMLGWLINVHTLHAVGLSDAASTDSFEGAGGKDVSVSRRLTPHRSHI